MNQQPFILLVDDDPSQEAFALLLSQQGVEAKHILPDELTEHDLKRANLLLLDEFIEEWSDREEVNDSVGLYVRDGVALAGVLRSAIDGRGPNSDTVPSPMNTAIVLRTGHLDVLAAGTPAFIQPMTIASRHDMEWVVEKSKAKATELASLARAAAALPTHWSVPKALEMQLEWLSLKESEWSEEAVAQIELCRPPWSVLAATSAGRRWLSWFLQTILPFPTFLVDDVRAASYLGITSESLDELLDCDSEFSELLADARYTGQLSTFAGRRWWRAGIAEMKSRILEDSEGRSAEDVANVLVKTIGSNIQPLGLRHPVFQIDASYNLINTPLEVVDAVRIQPDDWPSYADDPWLEVEAISSEPELAGLIVIDDRADIPFGLG